MIKNLAPKLISAFLFLVLFVSFSHNARAATLSLTKIGALATNGAMYPEWWYTGQNPTLMGTAANGATVSVSIDGTVSTATADASGNWSRATVMATGNHNIILTSGSESYAFVLHVGQDFPGTTGTTTPTTPQSTTPVPVTGMDQIAIVFISLGLVASGYYLYRSKNTKALFEKNALRE